MPTPSELALKKLQMQPLLARDEVVHSNDTWHIASGDEFAATRLTVNGRIVIQGKVKVV